MELSAETMKYTYVIAVMIDEKAYDIAKQFIDHLQRKNEPSERTEKIKENIEENKTEIQETTETEVKETRRERKKHIKKTDLEPVVDTHNNYEYIVDKKNDQIIVKYKLNSSTFHFPFSKVKELYDALPEEFTTKDLVEKAEEFGLQLTSNQAAGLIRVFAHVEFDAEIRRIGRQLIAVKMSDGYLREENRNKLRIEAETIGKPWKVEG
jgi:hypothetical protein